MPNSAHDVVIIGGGIAGLFCALQLAPRPVTILTGPRLGEGSSSAWAQGGLAAAVAAGDTPQAHVRDTVAAGAGIVDEALANDMCREAAARISDLIAYGVPFDKEIDGSLAVGREAAHSARRIVHVKGDLAGKAIVAALVEAVRRTPAIRVHEGLTAEDLVADDGRITAVLVRSSSGRTVIPTRAVVLATGGIGHLYSVTTNPSEAIGSGLAMAARAGAVLADTEFVQFHPTAIAVGQDPAPLASEALRGEGATLVNRAGKRFMEALHSEAELAPRDVVARGVFAEIAAGRGAFLDTRSAIGGAFPDRFPTIYRSCIAAGIDPVRDLIPVAPAAHYHMGGIDTDAQGRTSLDGLWAVGEVASTGVHGANRLASNSLLEAVVFAARAAQDIDTQDFGAHVPPSAASSPASPARLAPPAATASADSFKLDDLRALMSRHVGVVRNAEGLALALGVIARIERGAAAPALRNAATAALLIAAASWRRCESRGAHYRKDFPLSDTKAARRLRLTLSDARSITKHAADHHERIAIDAE
jgi:L-aspartate oxidase